ncbi:SGNH/GDSL hydrolase family protein [Mesobacillus maritimus]|uniref:SGNH/GDSL hydrolase family protein n=1 Tax=Mesobacillus maritimus TaxID=1643336 RepID=UPI002041A9F4|nr:SGNH/GDSL hydrolase family protein [Mesobacillus maritimus]
MVVRDEVDRRKAITFIVSLLGLCFLIFFLFVNLNQRSAPVSVNREALVPAEQLSQQVSNGEEPLLEDLVEEMEKEEKEETEEELVEDGPAAVAEDDELDGVDAEKEHSIRTEIKEKVREVIEGTLNLFKKELKIVAIGDSLTQGVGDETESGGYVGILNHTFEDNHVNVSIENYGKRGNRTDQLLKRLEQQEIEASIRKADVVLITIGSNDIMKVVKNNFMNLTLEPFEEERVEYRKRLRAIFDKINEINSNTQIYLVGFYNPFEGHFGEIEELGMIMTNWNDTGKSVTEEYENVEYIPVADLFVHSTQDLLAEDYFHPNTRGYKLMAQRVLYFMEEIDVEAEVSSDSIGNEPPDQQEEASHEVGFTDS